jgi:hypothetical protein
VPKNGGRGVSGILLLGQAACPQFLLGVYYCFIINSSLIISSICLNKYVLLKTTVSLSLNSNIYPHLAHEEIEAQKER